MQPAKSAACNTGSSSRQYQDDACSNCIRHSIWFSSLGPGSLLPVCSLWASSLKTLFLLVTLLHGIPGLLLIAGGGECCRHEPIHPLPLNSAAAGVVEAEEVWAVCLPSTAAASGDFLPLCQPCGMGGCEATCQSCWFLSPECPFLLVTFASVVSYSLRQGAAGGGGLAAMSPLLLAFRWLLSAEGSVSFFVYVTRLPGPAATSC